MCVYDRSAFGTLASQNLGLVPIRLYIATVCAIRRCRLQHRHETSWVRYRRVERVEGIYLHTKRLTSSSCCLLQMANGSVKHHNFPANLFETLPANLLNMSLVRSWVAQLPERADAWTLAFAGKI